MKPPADGAGILNVGAGVKEKKRQQHGQQVKKVDRHVRSRVRRMFQRICLVADLTKSGRKGYAPGNQIHRSRYPMLLAFILFTFSQRLTRFAKSKRTMFPPVGLHRNVPLYNASKCR